MKKILFLQIKGKSYAGVWNVNKLVGEELIKKGYTVHIVSIRNNQNDIILKYDKRLIVKTINEKDIWETYHIEDMIKELKKIHVFKAFKMGIERIRHDIKLKKDVKKLHEYIYEYKPDYIITSHYQLLDMIPSDYLGRTIHEQHTSLKVALSIRDNKKTFDKYKDKIKFLWLCKKAMENAIENGYINSTYIYNAVRIKSNERANVIKNKKLVTIARLSNEKRIDLMIEIVENIFKDSKYKDWVFLIYGDGDQKEFLRSKIKNTKQIKLMGVTDKPKEVLLSSAINLNTSPSEGFSLSILEAYECGIPTIAFNFGEATLEQIIDGKTGIIAKDIDDYQDKLKYLMDNPDELDRMSKNAKEYAKNFTTDNVISKWVELLK